MAIFQPSGVTTNTQSINNVVVDLNTAVSNLQAVDTALIDRADLIQGDSSIVGSLLNQKAVLEGQINSAITGLTNGAIKDNNDLLATLMGNETVDGSIDKKFSDLIGGSPEALNTLKEIATSIGNDPDLKNTLETLITTNIANAKDELKGGVSDSLDTMKELADDVDSKVATINQTATDNQTTLVNLLAQSIADNVPEVKNDFIQIGANGTFNTTYNPASKIVLGDVGKVFNTQTALDYDEVEVIYDVAVNNNKSFKVVVSDSTGYENKWIKISYIFSASQL